jgi:hypothetical protein
MNITNIDRSITVHVGILANVLPVYSLGQGVLNNSELWIFLLVENEGGRDAFKSKNC